MHTGIRKPLADLTSDETLKRSREYRLMAVTATTARVRDALLAMARMLERRAEEKEAAGAEEG